MPVADSAAPRMSNGRAGSAGSGSAMRRLSSTIATTIAACKRNDTRQLIVVVINPPISGPAAAPIPPIPLIAPNARAREVTSSNSSVARM